VCKDQPLKSSPTSDDSDHIPAFFPDPTQSGHFVFFRQRWDGRTGERLSNIRWLASRAIHRLRFGLLWSPKVRETLLECYSLLLRIEKIWTSTSALDLFFGKTLRLPPDGKQIHARIQDTQRIKSVHRWARNLDLALYLEGWERGAEWASQHANADSADSCTEHKARGGETSNLAP